MKYPVVYSGYNGMQAWETFLCYRLRGCLVSWHTNRSSWGTHYRVGAA